VAAVSPSGTTGAIPSSSAPPQTWTTDLFAATVLANLGAPITANNIANMTRWIYAESNGNLFSNGSTGNWLRDNNPLNINSTWDGASPAVHSWGTVYTYADPLTGAKATADFIAKNTPGVASALKSDAPSSLLGSAIQAAGWASGGYGGANPVAGGAWLADSNGNATSSIDLTSVSGWIKKNLLHGLTPTNQGLGAIDNAAGSAANASGLGALGSLSTFFSDLTDPTKLRRVEIFAAGAVLMVAGLVIFFASTDTGKKTIQTAATAALL